MARPWSCSATGIAGLRGKLPGVEPAPYIIRFTEDRPNPLYRRVCYTFAWSAAITFAVLNIAGLVVAIVTGQWYLKQIYRYAYFPIAGTIWLLGALGRLPRVMPSTKGEGHERRYFYGTVWAMCLAQPALWLMWYVLPQHARRQLAEAGDLPGHPRRSSAISRGSGGCLERVRSCPASSRCRTSTLPHCQLTIAALIGDSQFNVAIINREVAIHEGWQGWDAYADFYDWENAQTLDRRDVKFWQSMAERTNGPILELGCGTGRVTIPVARTGARIIGVDRSAEMLGRAQKRSRRTRSHRPAWLRGDIRFLPFRESARFDLVMAPYGILQSLVRESDLKATLASVERVLARGGIFGVDLVPDLPVWKEYRDKVRFRGVRRGGKSRITLVESVRQDRAKKLTIFDQEYIEQRGRARTSRRFSLVFRTLTVPQMTRRLENAGFRIKAVLGDYSGQPWDRRADVWLILAEKC